MRCLEERHVTTVDALLWCEECRWAERARAGHVGFAMGAVVAAGLTAWIWLFVRPSPHLVLGVWAAIVAAGWWISSKIATEVAYGVERFRSRRAEDVVPPAE